MLSASASATYIRMALGANSVCRCRFRRLSATFGATGTPADERCARMAHAAPSLDARLPLPFPTGLSATFAPPSRQGQDQHA